MKKALQRARAFVLDNWLVGVVVLAGSGIVVALLSVQLGSLVGGLSGSEFALQQKVAANQISLEGILKEPLFLPYYLGLYLIQLLPFSGPTAIRSVGALFGLMGALGFFYILHKWYSLRMALFGTALFATSSWFLHSARLASPEASYLLVPLLIAAFIGLQAKARSKWTVLAVIIFGFMASYIPGLIWFLIPAIILQRRVIALSLRMQRAWFNTIVALVCLVLLVPLVTMIALNLDSSTALHNILGLLGLPNSVPDIMTVLENVWRSISSIFFYSNLGPEFSPGHLPWFDICTTVLVLLGVVQFGKHYKLDRSKLLLIVGVFGLVLTSIGGPVGLLVLMPFLYLIAVEGMKWLLDSWLKVFPKNPFARSFGVTIIAVLVVMIGIYQTSRYFLAWGQSPETQAVYNKLP